MLWPEAETYYDLMKLRLDEGHVSFDSEKQNEPIDPSSCEFQEGWFRFFDEIVGNDGEVWLVPDQGERVKLSDCDIFGATDPSMGKQDKNRDPSAIVSIAAYPSQRIEPSDSYRFYFVLDAEIRRRHPHEIMQNIFKLHRLRRYKRHGIEAVQFQELFADDVQKAAQHDRDLQNLQIVKLNPLTDKGLRIQKLSTLVYTGRLRFSRKLTELYDQLRYFPQAAHDDGPDAVALCMEVIDNPGPRVINLDGAPAREEPLGRFGPQLRAAFGDIFDPPDDVRCGTCMYLVRRPNGRTFCDLRKLYTAATEYACSEYDYNYEGF